MVVERLIAWLSGLSPGEWAALAVVVIHFAVMAWAILNYTSREDKE